MVQISVFGFAIFGLLLVLGLFLFWLLTLIDCIKRKSDENDKVVWTLVIVFLGLLGSLIYYFVRKPKLDFGSGLGKAAKYCMILGLAALVLMVLLFALVFFVV